MIESFNEALVECVKAVGGSKVVGPKLWPEKPIDAAQRLLLDCLNPDRPAHLTPEQAQYVLRLARDIGYHAGAAYLMGSLSYAPPQPIDPPDERAELQRQYVEAARRMARMAERIEKLAAPGLRAAA